MNQRLRRLLKNPKSYQEGFETTTNYDREKGIRRIIKRESVQGILDIDINSQLTESSRLKIGNLMTIVGKDDQIADPLESVAYHKNLHGNEKNLLLLDSGHDVPYDLIEGHVNYPQTKVRGVYF